MGYSRIETPFAGGSQVFPVTFSLGYLNKADVTAYVQGEVDGSGNHAYRAFTWTDADHITVTAPLPNPCVLVTERTVSKNILTGNLGNGGDVTRSTVDRAVRQLMMVTHELMDGRVASFSEIDLLTGFVAAATDAKDIAEAQAALAAADRVLAQAGAATATASAATATTKAAAALASANAAAASAASVAVTLAGNHTFTGMNSFQGPTWVADLRSTTSTLALRSADGAHTFLSATASGVVATGYLSADTVAGDWVATMAEAQAGSSNTKLMTPLRVKEAIYANAVGFTPVQQGGGAGQGTNKVRIGYSVSGGGLKAQVDATDMGYLASAFLAATVMQEIAAQSIGAVGCYGLLSLQTTTGGNITHVAGSTHAGSSLRYVSAGGDLGGAPSGTWRCAGQCETSVLGTIPASDPRRITLFIRIT